MLKKLIYVLPVVAMLCGCSAANSEDASHISGSETNRSASASGGNFSNAEQELEDAVFATKYNTNNKNRAYNIEKAVKLLDGTTVKAGETFSYNDTIGDTSKKQGYKKAKIFIKGEETEGYGGGVCQLSSTLFNAAELADLEIVERHPHSKKVDYVGEGRDAATSYGGIDLKFKNTKQYPVTIHAAAQDGDLAVSIDPA